MVQSIAGRGVFDMTNEIEVEEIFPRFAAQGPGLNLGEVDITQGEGAQRAEESARNISRGEGDGRLETLCGVRPGIFRFPTARLFEKKKAGKIFAIVFDGFFEDFRAVDLSSFG